MVTPDTYPPLAVPPGPPPEEVDAEVDRRFERHLWWLVAGVLALALTLVGLSFRPGPAWAEMPSDRALLTVDDGEVTAVTGGTPVNLGAGDRRYVGAGTRLSVPTGALGRLTFPGGGTALFCGGVQARIGHLEVGGGRDRSVRAVLSLESGRVIADTTSSSGAYRPLGLTVDRAQGTVSTTSAAWFWVEPAAVTVSTGRVSVGSGAAKAGHRTLGCGDGVAVAPPTPITEAPVPSESVSVAPTQSVAPSVTATVPVPTVAPTVPPATAAPRTTPPVEATRTTRPPATHPTRPPRPTTKPATTPPTTPATTPPETTPPVSTPSPTPPGSTD